MLLQDAIHYPKDVDITRGLFMPKMTELVI